MPNKFTASAVATTLIITFETLAMNDVTVNDNNENGYEMKNIVMSRNQRTDMRAVTLNSPPAVSARRFQQ